MKTCIWCCRSEPYVSFKRIAHTFPKSLGGKSTCENVCDSCNSNFGDKKPGFPSVEIVLKEILNISKYLLLKQVNQLPKGKWFKTEFFNLNLERNTISLKPKYKLERGYQEDLGRSFRRGIYKVFLEEREKQRHDVLDSRFDFIRRFARYNLDDYPVYVFKPKFQAYFQ